MQKSHIFHHRPVAHEDIVGHNILIHIPRTAGTFFNNCLRANDLTVIDHIQRFIDSSDGIQHAKIRHQLSNRSTWISGHVRYDTLTHIFPPEENTRYFVLLRNPVNQLISQITGKRRHYVAPTCPSRECPFTNSVFLCTSALRH